MPARETGLIIVVDGLNEHPQADQFLQSIYAICREAGAESPMKVLFTFRSGNEQWFSPSEEDQALMMPPPARDDASRSREAGEKPLHTIGPLNLQETEAMWKEYAQEAPERFCPAFTFAEAMESSRRFSEVLRNPMLLRIFLATYHGRGQPERLTQCSLFGAYFDRLAEKTADDGQLLANIARLAVEQGTGKVALDLLFNDPSTGAAMRDTASTSAYDVLLREDVLSTLNAGKAPEVLFLIEVFMEYAAARCWIERGQAGSPPQIHELVGSEDAENPSDHLRNACRYALEVGTQKYGITFLTEWIDLGSDLHAEMAGPILAQLVLEAEDPAAVAKEVFAVPTQNDVRAVNHACDALDEELAYDQGKHFLEASLPAIESLEQINEDVSRLQ